MEFPLDPLEGLSVQNLDVLVGQVVKRLAMHIAALGDRMNGIEQFPGRCQNNDSISSLQSEVAQQRSHGEDLKRMQSQLLALVHQQATTIRNEISLQYKDLKNDLQLAREHIRKLELDVSSFGHSPVKKENVQNISHENVMANLPSTHELTSIRLEEKLSHAYVGVRLHCKLDETQLEENCHRISHAFDGVRLHQQHLQDEVKELTDRFAEIENTVSSENMIQEHAVMTDPHLAQHQHGNLHHHDYHIDHHNHHSDWHNHHSDNLNHHSDHRSHHDDHHDNNHQYSLPSKPTVVRNQPSRHTYIDDYQYHDDRSVTFSSNPESPLWNERMRGHSNAFQKVQTTPNPESQQPERMRGHSNAFQKVQTTPNPESQQPERMRGHSNAFQKVHTTPNPESQQPERMRGHSNAFQKVQTMPHEHQRHNAHHQDEQSVMKEILDRMRMLETQVVQMKREGSRRPSKQSTEATEGKFPSLSHSQKESSVRALRRDMYAMRFYHPEKDYQSGKGIRDSSSRPNSGVRGG